MSPSERRTILELAREIREHGAAREHDERWWRRRGVLADAHRRELLVRAQSLVTGADLFGQADESWTLGQIFGPGGGSGMSWDNGPLDTPAATATVKVRLIFARNRIGYKTIQLNLQWGQTVADALADIDEAADEMQGEYSAIDYEVMYETARIY